MKKGLKISYASLLTVNIGLFVKSARDFIILGENLGRFVLLGGALLLMLYPVYSGWNE